jgi:hypothetical protein
MQWFLTLFATCLPKAAVLRVWDLILLEGNDILLRTALAIWQTLAESVLRIYLIVHSRKAKIHLYFL